MHTTGGGNTQLCERTQRIGVWLTRCVGTSPPPSSLVGPPRPHHQHISQDASQDKRVGGGEGGGVVCSLGHCGNAAATCLVDIQVPFLVCIEVNVLMTPVLQCPQKIK